MTARVWLCTLNNPQDHYPDWEPEAFLEKMYKELKHVVCVQGQMEKKTCLHLQYKLWFSQCVRFSHIKRFCKFSSFTRVLIDNNVGYCAKDATRVDGPWTFGEIPLKMNNKEDRQTKTQKIMKKGIVQAVDDGDVSLMHVVKVQAGIDLYNQKKFEALPVCQGSIPIPSNWNVDLPLKVGKKRHYWFWSTKANFSKTYFLEKVAETHPSSWYDPNVQFQPRMREGSQFILMDEYSEPILKYHTFNRVCDGSQTYQIKGQANFVMKAIVLVCGNKHPREMYTNQYHLIDARFNVIDLEDCATAYKEEEPPKEEYIPMFQE